MEEPEERGEAVSNFSTWRTTWRFLAIPGDNIMCPFPHFWLVPHLPCLAWPLLFLHIPGDPAPTAVSQKAETHQHRPFQPVSLVSFSAFTLLLWVSCITHSAVLSSAPGSYHSEDRDKGPAGDISTHEKCTRSRVAESVFLPN